VWQIHPLAPPFPQGALIFFVKGPVQKFFRQQLIGMDRLGGKGKGLLLFSSFSSQ